MAGGARLLGLDHTRDLVAGLSDGADISGIDEAGVAQVTALIDRAKAAGLADVAAMLETVYWGWLRTTSAYRHGLPLVVAPPPGYSPVVGFRIVTTTIHRYAGLIPGTPRLDEATVGRAAEGIG